MSRKSSLYDKSKQVSSEFLSTKILLGVLNKKLGTGNMFNPAIENESLH